MRFPATFTHTVTVPAGKTIPLHFAGSQLSCTGAPSTGFFEVIFVRDQVRQDRPARLMEGFEFLSADGSLLFDSFEIKNPTGSDAVFELMISPPGSRMKDNRDHGEVTVSGGVEPRGASGGLLAGATIAAAGVATQIIDPTATASRVMIRPLDGAVYIGPAGVTAATGMLLNATEVMELETTAPVYAFAVAATDVRYLLTKVSS